MNSPSRWRFGPFEADLPEQQLRKGLEVVPVTRKSFALLVALLGRAGRLVSKDELFETVWAGTVVTDAALSRAIRELRVALGDAAGSPRYIATVHGIGFRFVADVVADAGAASSVSPAEAAIPATPAHDPASGAVAAASPSAMVVGRDVELARLAQALAAARAGRRQVILISGEAGIGKTSLVEAFAAQQAGTDAPWLASGRCIEQYGTVEPYLPVLEALESLAQQAGADTVRSVLLRYAPAWLAQLPWLAHDADPALLQRALLATSTQRMLREIAQALEVLAQQRPVVLWLEDLHWSDPSSLEVLMFLAGRREPARLVVLATLRPADTGTGDSPAALRAVVQHLVQRVQAELLPLGLLGPADTAAVIARRLQPATSLPLPALAQALHVRTGGHPLFTAAVLDEWVRLGQIVQAGGAWQLATPVDELGAALPESLRVLVEQQLSQLAADDLRLLEAAAVVGTDFSAAALAAALLAGHVEVEERCLRLVQTGRFLRHRGTVTWPDGTDATGFGFVHALYWQALYERVAPARRAEWQLAIARREEQAYGAHASQIATELAMRFEVARDWPRCLFYLRQAGAGALRRFAYVEGVELLRHGLMLLGRLPAAEQPAQELLLQLPLGAALMAVEGYAAADVEATYRRALELTRSGAASEGDVERALRGLWNVALVRAELRNARVAAEELSLRAAAAGNVSAAFDAFAKQGQTSMHRGDFTSARTQLEHALSLPLAAGDATRRRELPRVVAYLAWVQWYGGDAEGALARADEAVALAQLAGSAHSLAFALGFAGLVHHFRSEPAAMLERARQQQALAVEHGLSYWRVWSECLQGLADAVSDDSARGRARVRQALDDFLGMGAEVGVAHFLCALGQAEWQAGNIAQAKQTLEQSLEMSTRNANTYHAAETLRLLGECAAAGGDLERAHLHHGAALALATQQGAALLAERAARGLAQLAPRPR